MGRRRIVATALALVLIGEGCWGQPGGSAGNTFSNGVESTLTVDSVAALDEVWSGRGGVSAVMHGRVVGASWTVSGIDVVAHNVSSGAELWSRTLSPPGAVSGYPTHRPVVTGGDVWAGYRSGPPRAPVRSGSTDSIRTSSPRADRRSWLGSATSRSGRRTEARQMAEDPLDDVPVPAVGAPVPVALPDSLPLPATSAQVAQFVAYRAAACVGANYANLALLDDSKTSLRLYHDSFLDRDIADRYTDVPVDASYPIAAAVRERRLVLLPDLKSYRVQFPDILSDTVVAGVRSSASLPLHRADGTVLGALAFAWTEATRFDPKLEAALRAVGVLCVETVERAERYDADHELVVAMQRRLLGELPSLPGIETAARYLPATASLAVGGDWYEGLALADTRMALVVGDVTGHGVTAAADMALIRGMVTALLHSGVATSDVFSELSDVLSQRTGLVLATAALVVVDVEHETVTFATAGHPPPLLCLPDGEVRRLDSANSPIIGVRRTRKVADTAPFPMGSRLVMYTDGLVERRDRPVDDGIDAAIDYIRAIGDGATGIDIVDGLVGELVGDHVAEDDIALLVIQHTGRPAGDVTT